MVRSTALLPAIKRKHPNSVLIWVTDQPSVALLKTHPMIDRVVASGFENLLPFQGIEWDAAYILDKSPSATALADWFQIKEVFGFRSHKKNFSIVPATPAADELWQLGRDNQKKFFENKKSELRLCHEALELGPYLRDEYALFLTDLETEQARTRRANWLEDHLQPVIGINTGCSPAIPYKKWTIAYHRDLILKLNDRGFKNIVLLGGNSETERNQQIGLRLPVSLSDTQSGLRDGLVSVQACDLIISGDSLGMHLGIALKKFVVAWFGPTCEQEIDLFDRGAKVLSKAPCGPCWKRSCQKETMCYDLVYLSEIIASVEKGMAWWKENNSSWLSKPLSSEIFY